MLPPPDANAPTTSTKHQTHRYDVSGMDGNPASGDRTIAYEAKTSSHPKPLSAITRSLKLNMSHDILQTLQSQSP